MPQETDNCRREIIQNIGYPCSLERKAKLPLQYLSEPSKQGSAKNCNMFSKYLKAPKY